MSPIGFRFDLGNQFRMECIGNLGRDDADQSRFMVNQAASDLIGAIIIFFDRIQNPCSELGADCFCFI